jgi:hypothetical protein
MLGNIGMFVYVLKSKEIRTSLVFSYVQCTFVI